jgi:plasmid stabilization system protein ParE
VIAQLTLRLPRRSDLAEEPPFHAIIPEMPYESVYPSRALSAYVNSPIMRAAVAAIRYIGGAIDAFFGTWGAEVIQRRLDLLFEELESAAEKLEDGKVDKEYLHSEEFFDLLLRVFREASSTRHQDKIQLYARILVGSSNLDRPTNADPEDLLRVLAGLSPSQVGIARTMYQMSTDPTTARTGPILPPAGPSSEFNLL